MIEFIQKNKILLSVHNERLQEAHFHQDVELIYVFGGKMRLKIYEKVFELQREDVVVINSNELHGFEAKGDILFARLLISYGMIRQVYGHVNSRFMCNSAIKNSQDYTQLRRTLKGLLRNYLYLEQNKSALSTVNYEYMAQYFHLLELLTVDFLMNTSEMTLTKREKNEWRMSQIRDYVEANYSSNVSFEALARHMYLSEGYLSRYFKQNFHMKFTDYVRKLRLSHAMDELLYTSSPVTKIAYDNGFSSVSFFNKAFKDEYGKTPSAVRAENGVHVSSSLIEAGDCRAQTSGAVKKQLEDILENGNIVPESGLRVMKEVGSFSVTDMKPMEQCWNKVINMGSAADLLKSEVQEHVLLLSRALHYEYVRFWSIFSREMLIDVDEEEGSYNFAKLDLVLDFIVKQGMKPFIDLEEKPRRINQNTTKVLVYEENAVAFKNIEQWQRLFEALMRHWVKRYGIEELSGWKLEVWFGGYTIEGMDMVNGYFHIFRCVYGIVKHYAPRLEIGGSGLFPGYLNDIRQLPIHFWKEWRQQAPKPDFISVMNFAYEPDLSGRECFGKRSSDELYLLHRIQSLKQELKEAGFDCVKLYITEWNLTVSDRNHLNDSCFLGAYMIKNVIDACQQVDMLGYYSGSDRTSEYYDSGQLLHGGRGLLSKDSIFKPVAFGIDFLNHMYGNFVHSGSHYLLTADGMGNYNMVCHNMRPLSHYYYLTPEERIEKDKVWCCFEDLDPMSLEFCLEDMENGEYLMKIHRVNRSCGSILDEWAAMNYHRELLREDIKYFRRVCEPRMAIENCVVEKRQLNFLLKLEANEIALIQIHKEL